MRRNEYSRPVIKSAFRHLLPMLLLAWGAACLASAEEGAPSSAARRDGPSLGFRIDLAAAAALPRDLVQDPDRGMILRFVATWADVERAAGVYDWSGLAEETARLHGLGYRVVLCLSGSNPLYLPAGELPSPLAGESLPRWVEFVRSAVRTLGSALWVLEIWDSPDGTASGPAFAPDLYAFLLKSSALAARAEARERGTHLQVAQGAAGLLGLAWQRALLAEDVAPYIDILPVRVGERSSPGAVASTLKSFFDETLASPPVPKMWAYVEPGREPGLAASTVVEALASTAETALAPPVEDPQELEREARWMYGIHRVFGAGYAPAPEGSLQFSDPAGDPRAGPRVLGRFVHEEDLSNLVVYSGPLPRGTRPEQALLGLDVRDARDASVLDPASGQRFPSAIGRHPTNPGLRTAGVLLTDHPMALIFHRVTEAPVELPSEKLDVSGAHKLTAEEIIARHQQVQRVQDDRLHRFTARGRTDLHFKLAQSGGTVDVSVESNYFWERGGELEWEQTDYSINGNRVTWSKIPELPLVQPEKVATVPLDLTLDRTYVYRLAGEEGVLGREAYVLAFEPPQDRGARALYRGRVWIDRETFARLQVSVVQTGGLEAPVLSNEEKSVYGPVAGPGGETFSLVTHTRGQQIWTTAGRNFVVQREVTFTSFDINPAAADFEGRRRSAYASEHQMLRDTDHGLRYLQREPDGSRSLKESLDSSQFFIAAGLYKDNSLDTVVPLGGVNYFNYDVGHKNIQTNVFFAGVLLLGTLTDPAVLGTRLDATAEVTGFALKRDDRIYVGAQEIEAETVQYRSQNVSARLGLPAGPFVKLSLIGDLTFLTYDRADATDPAFVLPRDHRVLTGTVQWEFNRKGYGVTLFGAASRRSSWAPWGSPDTITGGFPAFDPSDASFLTWGAAATKEWFLPRFQRIRGSVNYLDGGDLDRFSRYQFSFFGDARLNGFAGTGVRFDRGWVARGAYDFNLFEVLRIGVDLDTARVLDLSAPGSPQRFTGVGVSGNIVGPWMTVISVGYGRALRSDIPDLEGMQEFFVAVYKLFARN